jgi:serine/threonine protein kinase
MSLPEVDNLEFIEKIGVGTFGEVFKGLDRKKSREVAIKLDPTG